jgi:hypothetical protein
MFHTFIYIARYAVKKLVKYIKSKYKILNRLNIIFTNISPELQVALI